MKTTSRFGAYIEVPVPRGVTIMSPAHRGMEPPMLLISAESEESHVAARALILKMVDNVIKEAARS